MSKTLVVDDIPSNRLLVKVMLEQAGLQVLTAECAKNAMERLDAEKVDLILLDVMMPEVSGFEFAQLLKNHPVYNDIPIIFLTALDDSENIATGFHVGAEDYIPKPVKKEELLARVKHQLDLVEARKKLQQKTEELQKAIEGRDRMYEVIAHDLRTPISSLKMVLNAMIYQTQDKSFANVKNTTDLLQDANQITEQLFDLLNNLLKWTRSQLKRLDVVPQTTCLSELAQGVVCVFSPIASAKDIKINYISNPNERTEIHVDIDMVKTAMRNLLGNAIKFSYPNSTIEVEVSSKNQNAIFTVTDHGCGIKKEKQCKLMNITTHFSTHGTAQESGSGLGLLLVNEFLKLNNGRFFFNSEEGKGSTFGFEILLLKEVSS